MRVEKMTRGHMEAPQRPAARSSKPLLASCIIMWKLHSGCVQWCTQPGSTYSAVVHDVKKI